MRKFGITFWCLHESYICNSALAQMTTATVSTNLQFAPSDRNPRRRIEALVDGLERAAANLFEFEELSVGRRIACLYNLLFFDDDRLTVQIARLDVADVLFTVVDNKVVGGTDGAGFRRLVVAILRHHETLLVATVTEFHAI